jgi:hypothetical protein
VLVPEYHSLNINIYYGAHKRSALGPFSASSIRSIFSHRISLKSTLDVLQQSMLTFSIFLLVRFVDVPYTALPHRVLKHLKQMCSFVMSVSCHTHTERQMKCSCIFECACLDTQLYWTANNFFFHLACVCVVCLRARVRADFLLRVSTTPLGIN